jgi:hypothetical protein
MLLKISAVSIILAPIYQLGQGENFIMYALKAALISKKLRLQKINL